MTPVHGISPWIAIAISSASFVIALVALLRPVFANRRTAGSLSILILGEARIAYQHARAIEKAARDHGTHNVDAKFASNCRAHVNVVDIPTLFSIQKELACFKDAEAKAHAASIVHWRTLVAAFGKPEHFTEVNFDYGVPAPEIVEIVEAASASLKISMEFAAKRTRTPNDLSGIEQDALSMSEWIHARTPR